MGFLPAEAVEKIAHQASTLLHRRMKRGDLQVSYHFRPVTTHEVWAWICQRLQFSLGKKKNLREHFNSVRVSRQLTSPDRSSNPCLRERNPLGGCFTIDSLQFKAT
jgi:hypothetical protein